MQSGTRVRQITALGVLVSGWTLTLLSVLIIALLGASLCAAQNTNSGNIRGTVTDQTGAMIPAARVTLLNIDTGVTTELTTNGAGIYEAVSILPGSYRITFSKEGFQSLVREGITLQVGVLMVDAQLSVGASATKIEVSTEATLLKTETAEQSTTLEAETMRGLPNVGQDWQNFMKLLPGASGAPSASQGAANPGAGIAVNGNLPFYSNFLADGASTVLPHSANTDVSIFETVSELQVNTSTFSAQYGIGGAVFNQISKGGTNQWHGTAYEYFQNDALNARDFFSPSVANLRYNQFGGSVGGPILKNKAFFYFDLDKTINNTNGYGFMNVPTAPMRAGNFSDPIFSTIYDPSTTGQDASGNYTRAPFANNTIPALRIDKVAQNYQAYFPDPNFSGYTNNYGNKEQAQNPFLRFFGRIDYNLTDRNRLTFSITQRDNPAQYWWGPIPVILQEVGDVDSYNAQVSDVWSISTSTVNEFRFGYTRQGNWFAGWPTGKGYPQKIGIQNSKADIFPGMSMSGGPAGWTGIWDTTNATYIENSFTPSDIVTMIRGRHILHFGGELLAYQDNSTPWGNLQSGDYNFSGAYTQSAPFGSGGLGYADFLLGQTSSWTAANSPMASARAKSPQVFVQDDFKLRPNLTLNIGLRYEVQGAWGEKRNQVGTFDPTITNPTTGTLGAMWFAPAHGRDKLEAGVNNIFLPRLGVAYSPRTDWTIRGGFGIYSYGWSLDAYTNNAIGFGSGSTGNTSDSTQLIPVATLSGANANLPWIVASRAADGYNGQGVNFAPYHTPVARNYQWSLSVQHQIGKGLLAEAAYVGSHGTNLSFPVDINQIPLSLLGPNAGQDSRPYPQFQGISGNNYNAISNFNSLQLQLHKSLSSGLSFDVNYTWEKFMDEQDSSGWGSRGGNQLYQNSYDPQASYGPSNFDIPHMFKGDVVYTLPFGKGTRLLNRGGLVDAIVGGWQTSTIFVVQSGAPFTLTWSGNNNSGALAGSWYPNVVGDWHVSNQNIQEWYNPDAFAQPASYTFGNLGRNALRGPGLTSVDFSMGKVFRFPKFERGQLKVRIDATNVLNHPSFSNPGTGLVSPGVQQITSTTVTGRTVQLGVRMSF
ncbi:MAG: TonB-dependent receptor [Bryobacteraceae bacterium]|nr:TonB-dependent receptor [Bryobacteraceae bacterium]